MTLRERMGHVVGCLEGLERSYCDASIDNHQNDKSISLADASREKAGLLAHAVSLIRREMKKAELERMICPLMSKADPDVAGEVQPVFCLGRSCGMHALCQGTKIYNPVPVKVIKDSPVGL